MIRHLNDIVRAIIEALHTTTYLHNILHSKRLKFQTPIFALYQRHPTYNHLRVFGCAYYPNLSATQPHKLHPRSTRCIFLGYTPHFLGYRRLDPTTGLVHISHHVIFDEDTFPSTTPINPHLISSWMMTLFHKFITLPSHPTNLLSIL